MAVYWNNKWVRGYIENSDPSGQNNIVRLLDYGGYWQLNKASFKPMKMEYLYLPFQAIEVFLANIQPKEGNYWCRVDFFSEKSYTFCPIYSKLFTLYIILRFIRVFQMYGRKKLTI